MAETYTDPLALLDSPQPAHEPKPEPEMDTEFMSYERLKGAFPQASEAMGANAQALRQLDEVAEAVAEALPKVAKCYACHEWTFVSALSQLVVSDSGAEHGFCPECVRGIERRSKKPESISAGFFTLNGVPLGGVQTAELKWDAPWSYTVNETVDNTTLN